VRDENKGMKEGALKRKGEVDSRGDEEFGIGFLDS
jgi:hypothetical protein